MVFDAESSSDSRLWAFARGGRRGRRCFGTRLNTRFGFAPRSRKATRRNGAQREDEWDKNQKGENGWMANHGFYQSIFIMACILLIPPVEKGNCGVTDDSRPIARGIPTIAGVEQLGLPTAKPREVQQGENGALATGLPGFL